jgi:hypothetical protein
VHLRYRHGAIGERPTVLTSSLPKYAANNAARFGLVSMDTAIWNMPLHGFFCQTQAESEIEPEEPWCVFSAQEDVKPASGRTWASVVAQTS